ncbi:helix-turn-helix transcriptional regulator [Streptomyces sp. NBC_00878]|uniref:ArsR/SmtB family transcription factor n=1 Tax=Streptomyces sp. NBC_00878 TaxID=2975854 RepID=UPI0022592DD9|nr:winged helix-turn-helix domain-containing protein [Streptomyces sp. NBC_00878]MCX4906159.1 helix-turn-helix domain-containing protein [Streptomyces sp. NBC_00878]
MSLAEGPALLTETVISLRILQQRRPGPVFGTWQRWARQRMPRSVHRLRSLVQPNGAVPDFLTPNDYSDLDAGLDAVLHTPKSILRTDLDAFAQFTNARLPSWADPLSEGCPRALETLTQAMRDWHKAAIAPMGQHLHSRIKEARLSAARTLLAEGLDAMLSRLHPTISWKSPVLELACPDHDMDIYLEGRGLRLVPSLFCGREAAINLDPGLPPVVFYPVAHETLWTPDRPSASKTDQGTLGALLGPTRAAVLQVITAGYGITTTELARHAGISAATVSHHTALLREAGLIATHRTGPHAHHLPTPLGARLVNNRQE